MVVSLCCFVCELERWTIKMWERQNAIVYALGLRSPSMSNYEIHKRIYARIRLNYLEATMVHIDRPKLHIHINFLGNGRMQDVFYSTGGQVEYRHSNCEISAVRIITATELWCYILDKLWRVIFVMRRTILIIRARCDLVGRRRHPYPSPHLSAYSVEGDRKYIATP